MPSITDMLHPHCPEHPHVSTEKRPCWFCTYKPETPQERDARMDAFYKRFPRVVAAAVRHGVPGHRSEDETYSEGLYDDD